MDTSSRNIGEIILTNDIGFEIENIKLQVQGCEACLHFCGMSAMPSVCGWF